MKMVASSITPVAPDRAPARAEAAISGVLRLSNSSRRMNMVAALEAAEKLVPSRPAKAATSATPSVFMAISTERFMAASVRSSEAPGGSCTTPIRKP